MKIIQKYKPILLEMMRFGLVGFISFLFDWGVLELVLAFVFQGEKTNFSITVATAAGFVVGVSVNYFLSVVFVFKAAKSGAGKNARAAVIFLIGAAIGLLLTQIIMNLGTIRLGFNQTPVKVIATGIVMIWNYLFRKIFIFNEKKT